MEGPAPSSCATARARSSTPTKHGIPIPVSKKKIYSQDRNLWHISHEGAEIEHPDNEPNWEACLTMTVPPAKAPNEAEIVEVDSRPATPSPSTASALAAATS